MLAAVLAGAMLLAGCARDRPAAGRSPAVGSSAVHAAARPSAPSAPATTVVHTVAPWTASGHLTVASSGAAPGSCFTSSLAAPAPTTYRCFHGNALLDPCFVSPTSDRTVACLATPWSTAQVLTLRAALPAPVRTGSGRLWALQLADGTHCVAATGTVPQVHGVNLSYSCGDGSYAEPVNPGAQHLVVQRARLDATTLTRTAASAAWHA